MDTNIKRLPYGLCNFEDLITENYGYVDKTRYIALLEQENNPYQIFIRPRKFGKSLFFSLLSCYYDINYADKFNSLFGGLYIGQHPTPNRNGYAMLKFDFSGINTSSAETLRVSFYDKVRGNLLDFVSTYGYLFPNADSEMKIIQETVQSTSALITLYRMVKAAGVKLFVIIDEYDHFANDLIALGTTIGDDVYHRMVQANGMVRDFYEVLKDGTKSVVKRIFITGISPVMLNDLTSGFNIADNLTLDVQYNEMLGFTQDEVNAIMGETGVNPEYINVNMERYYNGYLFNEDGAYRVYNPAMVLYFFNQILKGKQAPEKIVDDNNRTDYARLQRLVQNDRNRETLLEIVKGNGIIANIASQFSIDEMYNDDYFISLLFYMGLLTIDTAIEGDIRLKIPNYSIQTLYWEYIERLTRDLNTEVSINVREQSAAIRELAYRGNPVPYLEYISKNIFSRLSNRDLIGFDEKYIKIMLLNGLFQSNLYEPVTEREIDQGYLDMYLQRNPRLPDVKYEWVWELKYLKKEDSGKLEAKRTAA
ncbi:MAG: ATP-binding protein, partial [Treponema sp.]|nr:ATP-binding protein [Treponema sp.]